jgi:Leucine-rich repeat (LRR) protein
MDFIQTSSFLTQCPKINQLNFHNCGFLSIPSKSLNLIKTLEILDFSSNVKLTDLLEDGKYEMSLEYLQDFNAANSAIKSVPSEALSLKSLKVINLSNNNITNVGRYAIPSVIEALDLQNNKLTIPDFRKTIESRE